MWITRGAFKNQKQRDAAAKERAIERSKRQAESDAKKHANTLPDDVIHVPLEHQYTSAIKGLSPLQSVHLSIFPGILLCCAIYGAPWQATLAISLYMLFVAYPDKAPTNLGDRKGLLISPDQVTFVDNDGVTRECMGIAARALAYS